MSLCPLTYHWESKQTRWYCSNA